MYERWGNNNTVKDNRFAFAPSSVNNGRPLAVAGQHHKHQVFGGIMTKNRRNFKKDTLFLGIWESEHFLPESLKSQRFEY